MQQPASEVGKVICLSLCTDWDLDYMEQAGSLPLHLSIIPEAPTHPIGKEESTETSARITLYFILLWK